MIEQEVAYLADDYMSEEELEASESCDDGEENTNGANTGSVSDRFGGVYLGDEVSDFSETYHTEAFEYTQITLGEDGKKGKGKKRSPDEEKINDLDDKHSVSNFQSRNFNVDDSGNFTEQSLSLMSGVERIVDPESTAGIFLGGGDETLYSGKNDLRDELLQTLSKLEKLQTTKIGGSETNLAQCAKSTPKKAPDPPIQVLTRSIYGEGGIYLGEEEVDEPRDEREKLLFGSKLFAPEPKDEREKLLYGSKLFAPEPKDEKDELLYGSKEERDKLIYGSKLFAPTQEEKQESTAKDVAAPRQARFERMFSGDLQLDNLRPIREVDSKENISDQPKSPTAEEISISIEEVLSVSSSIDIQGGRVAKERNGDDRSMSTTQPESYTSQFSSLPSDNSSSRQSPIDFRTSGSIDMNDKEDKRARSLSLPARKDSLPNITGSRSASFSGVAQNMPSILQGRSESDPGMSGDSRAESFSSQDSEKENRLVDGKRAGLKSNEKINRNERRIFFPETTSKLGLRERSDSDERRAKNFTLDVSNASRRLRRPRGNTVTLSVSPASFRVGSVSSYCESPVVASARDALGYAAWTTLRKQRTFRKEIDLKIQQSSAISPYRQIMERRNNRRGYVSFLVIKSYLL